jgi:hypothetical protein
LQATKFSENDIHTFTIALSRYQRIIEVMDITDMFEESFSKDTLNVQVVLLLLERGKLGHPEETVVSNFTQSHKLGLQMFVKRNFHFIFRW